MIKCPRCHCTLNTFQGIIEHQLSHSFKRDGKIACYCDELTTWDTEREYLDHCEELLGKYMAVKGLSATIIRHYHPPGVYVPVKGGKRANPHKIDS